MKLFITKRIPGKEDCILLRLLLGQEDVVGGLFQKIESAPYQGLVTFVDTIDEADYLFMPHNYFSVESNSDYLKAMDTIAATNNKKIIVFAYGDSTRAVKIKNSVVLRTSQYKSKLKKNEIIIPPFVEDLGSIYGYSIRTKTNQKPVIGFAGWAGFKNPVRFLKYLIKLTYVYGPKRQGIYFRRKIINHLKNATSVVPLFILRDSFSGHLNDIEDSPEKIRKEYIDTIVQSDLALAVRGDGNYSLRFFEILSLGRIPLFVDTDMALPLETDILYADCVLHVDHVDILKTEQILNSFWEKLTSEDFICMQNAARKVFVTKLNASIFYKNLFEKSEIC